MKLETQRSGNWHDPTLWQPRSRLLRVIGAATGRRPRLGWRVPRPADDVLLRHGVIQSQAIHVCGKLDTGRQSITSR